MGSLLDIGTTKAGGTTAKTRKTTRSLLAADPAFAWLANPSLVIALIAVYLLGHFVLRLILSPTLGLDDAEQILFAQHWAFGYRFRQPPLFTWLLLPVIELVGPGVLAISIVRYALLGVTYVFLYLTARLCLHDQRMAGLSVLSFALIYVFAYYAHHDLTHTTALGAMIALTFYVTASLARNPTWTAYLIAGAVLGLGMLAKWNFALLAIGLLVTCLLMRDVHHLVFNKKILGTLAVMAVVLTPTALWMFAHDQSVGSVSNTILSAEADMDRLALWIEGGGALLRSILLFPLPYLPLFLLLFAQSLRAAATTSVPAIPATLPPTFFSILMVVVLALHLPLIPLFGAVNFTERWLHPALMAMPIALFALAERGRPEPRSVASYLTIIAIVVAVAAGARLYRYAEGAEDCGRCREFAPFAELADGLRAAGFSRGTIIADGMHIGGNLKMLFTESRVIDPAFPPALWPHAGDHEVTGTCLLVWQDEGDRPDARRAFLKDYAVEHLDLPSTAAAQSGHLDAPLLGSSNRRYALGFELYQENTGGCR